MHTLEIMANLILIVFYCRFEDPLWARHPGRLAESEGLVGLTLCLLSLQQPRAGGPRRRETKWAHRVLGSLRAAAPKGQYEGERH